MLTWRGEEVLAELRQRAAEGLLRAVLAFQAEHMQRLNVSAGPRSVRRQRTVHRGGDAFKKGSRYTAYDTPSKPGEYLHVRTGHGRGSVTVEPASVQGIIEGGLEVRIDYRLPAGVYMLRWELDGHRKGLLDTLADLQPTLTAMLKGAP